MSVTIRFGAWREKALQKSALIKRNNHFFDPSVFRLDGSSHQWAERGIPEAHRSAAFHGPNRREKADLE
jgi:hypothetical protein